MQIKILEPLEEFNVEQFSHRILNDIFANDDCMTVGMSHLKELWVKSCGFFRNSWKREKLCQSSAFATLVYLGWMYVSERNPPQNITIFIILFWS